MKSQYGTQFFDENSVCEECGEKAIGVLVIDHTGELGNKLGGREGRTLCTPCKKFIENKGIGTGEITEWRRFVD